MVKSEDSLVTFPFSWLQAEAEEPEVEQQQLHYQQTSISHACKMVTVEEAKGVQSPRSLPILDW